MDNLTILVFVNRYLPGYKSGGPIRSVANIVERMGKKNLFYIVTSDRDSGDTEPYNDIKKGEWNKVGNARVRYLGPEEQNIRVLLTILKKVRFDIVYINSLFNLFSHTTIFFQSKFLVKFYKKLHLPNSTFNSSIGRLCLFK